MSVDAGWPLSLQALGSSELTDEVSDWLSPQMPSHDRAPFKGSGEAKINLPKLGTGHH